LQKPFLKIALDVPLDRLFDYLSNGEIARIGQRVLVPFGRKELIGIVMGSADTSDIPVEKLKSVIQIFHDEPQLDAHTLNLVKFSADYYHYPFGQALLSVLPARLKQIAPAKTRESFIYKLTEAGKHFSLDALNKRQQVLRRVLQALQTQHFLTDQDLSTLSATAKKSMQTLIADGLALAEKNIAKKQFVSTHSHPQLPALNAEQQAAVDQILLHKNSFTPWLLHGITGSGKTEVYMRLIQAVLLPESRTNIDAQVLVLVPEINLTPQLEARFKNRFPDFLLVSLHSNLSESDRLLHWQLAQSGEAKIVIGTRLSTFTPMPHLKMLIIDEEHDASYKQQDSMRYHARNVAMMRAKRLNIPIILGSATPSLETWYNVKADKYQYLALNQRAVSAAQLPEIHCVDTSKVHLQQGFTPQLLHALRTRLARKEQSLIFMNRRGFSPVLLCSACQWIAPCTRCSSRLVVHLKERKLRCHHCNFEQKIPLQCPSCGNPDLHPTGLGTQRLEETLAQLLPEARIARIDRDSTTRKNALVDMLNRVHNQEIDILVGTQMLAKGHDFPNLTLVGVMDTDQALYSPDFRASERLFAQLMQVAGRAGRADKKGEVLIQTEFPFHALFNALRTQDYVDFANAELEGRKLVNFPPFVHTALLRAESNRFTMVMQFLEAAFAHAYMQHQQVTVYEPVRPQMERMKGMERAHMLLQSSSRGALQHVLKNTVSHLRTHPLASKVRWAMDVDPLEF
jgi:primosomal protein N' (replication factor Y)